MVISLDEFRQQRRIAAVLADATPRWSGQTRARRAGDAGNALRHRAPALPMSAIQERVAIFPAPGPREPMADLHAGATLI